MARRFIDAPDALRCKAAIILKDKSGAQCGRYAKIGDYCTQHARMANMDPAHEDARELAREQQHTSGMHNPVY